MKKSLDKDLKRIVGIEDAAREAGRRLTGLGWAAVFLVLVWAFSTLHAGGSPDRAFIIMAGIIGGYMALNIGANDVANNIGPAVGSRALSMMGALLVAAVFEALGAILAGGDVVSTISKSIIDPTAMADDKIFITAMMAALLAAALWINIATFVSAPVSTTHSVVGGVTGAGIAAAGFTVVNWGTMAKVAASWVISPVLGGLLAAAFLAFIKIMIIYQDDKVGAAKRWVPVLVALMAAVFNAYLVMKGLKRVWQPGFSMIAGLSVVVFLIVYWVFKPWVAKRAQGMENRNKSVRSLFTVPLICSAALLSFAHGSNDVANAVGPLSAIVSVAQGGDVAEKVGIPLWIMLIGATGICAGLLLFGPKLVRVVGEQITKMNPMRAYCVALSAGITVLIASALGLPVSSTHIAVGAVFGVGFFREYFTSRPAFQSRTRFRAGAAVKLPGRTDPGNGNSTTIRRRKLVRRVHLVTIVAAWVVTVPLTALMAAAIFFALRLAY